jgi:hypothetical protein
LSGTRPFHLGGWSGDHSPIFFSTAAKSDAAQNTNHEPAGAIALRLIQKEN